MDSEKLEKSKNNLLEQLEERKKLKKLKKKTKEESAFSDEFGSKKKLQPTLPISPEQQNNKGEKKLQQTLPKSPKKIKTLEEAKNKKTLQPAFNKGGRVGYKTGTRGCKLAMKGKGRAYGKNS